ncbi:hypothetical protein EDD17DRAFT_104222 [Pisolithus thermaeus]|nr:hypothetical protein EDD17DRAFT_104222 [Pisolithus thermaeus]
MPTFHAQVIWHNNLAGTYMYYMHDFEDPFTTKFIVASVWVLDTLHVSFMCHMVYHYLITDWGIPTSLEYIVWSFPASILVDVVLITIVQIWFARTIHCLCRRQLRWLVTVPIALLVLAHIGFAMATAIVIFVKGTIGFVSYTRFYTTTPAASSIALAEVLITTSLCTLLRGSRSDMPRMKHLLNTLIIYAVNRCLLTLPVVVAMAVLGTDNLFLWAAAFDFIVGKLYVNSFLASLNTRQHLRSRGSGPESALCMNAAYFASPPKLPVDARSSGEEAVRRLADRKVFVIDITTEPASDNTTTAAL